MCNKETDLTEFLDAAELTFERGYFVGSPLYTWAKKRSEARERYHGEQDEVALKGKKQ